MHSAKGRKKKSTKKTNKKKKEKGSNLTEEDAQLHQNNRDTIIDKRAIQYVFASP